MTRQKKPTQPRRGSKKTTAKQLKKLKKLIPIDEPIEGEIMEDEERDGFGRPTVVTERVKGRLLEAFAWGCSNKEAALHAGIAERTIDNYNKRDPKFKAHCLELKDSPTLKARITLIKSLDNPFFALKYLERKRPKEFAMRIQQMFELPEPMDSAEQALLDQAIDENIQ